MKLYIINSTTIINQKETFFYHGIFSSLNLAWENAAKILDDLIIEELKMYHTIHENVQHQISYNIEKVDFNQICPETFSPMQGYLCVKFFSNQDAESILFDLADILVCIQGSELDQIVLIDRG